MVPVGAQKTKEIMRHLANLWYISGTSHGYYLSCITHSITVRGI